MQRSVLLPGKNNKQSGLEACRASCLAEAACTAWLYCWRPGGCDDGVNYNNYWCAPGSEAWPFSHTCHRWFAMRQPLEQSASNPNLVSCRHVRLPCLQ